MSKNFLGDIESYIEEGIKQMDVPGATVCIIKDSEIIFSGAFGYADVENEINMTTNHILPIGSSSKSFTATAAIMLADQGLIDLDKPIINYMPEFRLYDKYATIEATPRDLLCHRTGMPRHDLMWINWNDLKREDLVKNRLQHLKPNKPFRSKWQYQNHMYATIGYLVEKVTGIKWERYIEENIFSELGIKDYSFEVKKDGKYAKLYTKEDETNINNEPLKIDAMGPAGSINATAEEMIKWVDFNLNKGKAGEKQLISEEKFVELHDPYIPYKVLPISFKEQVSVGYGLGWTIDLFRGNKMVSHGGNVNGASANIAMLPEHNLGCVILTNAHSTLLGYALAAEIFDRYLGFSKECSWTNSYHEAITELSDKMSKKAKAVYEDKVPNTDIIHDIDDYTGEYTHSGYGTIKITKADDKLNLKFHDNEFELEHLHYDIFTFEFYSMVITTSFITGIDGSIDNVEIPFEPNVEPIKFIKDNCEKVNKK